MDYRIGIPLIGLAALIILVLLIYWISKSK